MGFPVYVNGRGRISSDVLALDTAVNEYDERLMFGTNPETGDWCIFVKMPWDWEGPSVDGNKALPILGFGKELPSRDYAIRQLYQSDSLRHGEQILDEMNRQNKAVQDVARAKSDDQSGQLAEVLEWGFRKKGVHPSSRVFVPDTKGD